MWLIVVRLSVRTAPSEVLAVGRIHFWAHSRDSWQEISVLFHLALTIGLLNDMAASFSKVSDERERNRQR